MHPILRTPLLALLLWQPVHAADVAPVPPPAPPPPVTLLTDHAIDGMGGELRGARIRIAGGRIESLSAPMHAPGARTIDLRGYTVLPGWIDTHVHLAYHFDRSGRIATDSEAPLDAATGIAAAAWDTLMGGFTTVQSVGDPSEKSLRDAIRDHGFPGPRVLTSLAWIEGTTVSTDDELRAAVRERKAAGADLIKIFASSSQRVGAMPTLSEHQLRVLCDEAHAVGLRSMVHAYRSQVAAAARAGCREIEHATYASKEDIEVAVAAGAYLSPQVGLVVQNYIENKARYLGVGNYSEQGMQTMLRDLPEDERVCSIAVRMPGAKVVFSTDATAGAHGRNAEEFLGRVQRCGQAPMDALVSANALAAEALGLGDRLGRIAPGYEADVIALDGDPLKDLTAVRRVVFVMRGGVVYKWAGAPSSTH
jgi:imidazolonepropionase-like amidohydrolase